MRNNKRFYRRLSPELINRSFNFNDMESSAVAEPVRWRNVER
ncbi:MAG: hypothetical protein ACI8PD_001587, partial [Nitrospinales bacterium]